MKKVKTFTILIISFLYLLSLQAQNAQYKVCSGCTEQSTNDNSDNLFVYSSDPITYFPEDVEGNYDLRWYPGVGNHWHKGIDYSSHGFGAGHSDRGDALLAIEGGTIVKIKGINYKYVVIEGENGNHFGYGHLFLNGNLDEQRSGNFVLKSFYHEDDLLYAIINLETCTAYASVSDITITYENTFCEDIFTTTNSINQGDSFAPIGGSPSFVPHLHLYKFRAPYATNLISNTNCMDPWSTIGYPNINGLDDYSFEIHSNGEQNNVVSINYPSSINQTIRVRAEMRNATAAPNDNSRYSNKIMAIDEIKLKIKKDSDNTYDVIRGGHYESRINLGGRDINASNFYPSENIITGLQAGWNNHTGMGANPTQFNSGEYWVYKDGVAFSPYDYYYLGDILFRINKNDAMNGMALIADSPLFCRYNDGLYTLKVEEIDVMGNTDEGPKTNDVLTPVEFTLDNFMPFITEVKMFQTDLLGGPSLVYGLVRNQSEGQTNVLDDGYIANTVNTNPVYDPTTPYELSFEINTSEPMDYVDIEIEGSNYRPDTILFVPGATQNGRSHAIAVSQCFGLM